MALPDRVPPRIGRFVVESILGAGGMGAVYKALDPNLKRIVAVKTVLPDKSEPSYLERLLSEAQACARLRHNHIVTVHEAGEIDGTVFVVMEYLEGEDLAQALDRGDIPFRTRVQMLIETLDALQHAHANGVIHRDIKPSNIRVLPNGSIKLVDFGLARINEAASRTVTGTIMGTLHYASPEQLRGERVDARTDLYSTGTMAYEMFCGQRPFDGPTPSTIILKVIYDAPPPMGGHWTGSFPELARIVSRAMAKSAAERYQTAEDMRNALSAFLSSSQDRISAVEAQDTIVAQQSLIQAQTLITSGKPEEARSFLVETVKRSPHAPGVKKLLETLPSAADVGTVISPSPEPAAPQQLAPSTPAIQTEGRSTMAITSPPVDSISGGTNVVTPTPAPRPKWLMPAAAVLLVGVLIGVYQYGWAPAPVTTIAGNTETPVKPPENPAAPGTDAGPAGGTSVPTPGTGATPANPAPSEVKSAALTPADASIAKNPGAARPGEKAATPAPPPVGEPAKPAPAPAVATVASTGKTMFYASQDGAASAPNTGMRYRVTRMSPEGSEADIDLATAVFHAGDRVRLSFETNVDGYLYVVQQGSSGRWSVLFPNPDINFGRNAVRRAEEYKVPDDGWFQFDATPGVENLFVFFSKEPLQSLPGFERPVSKPETLTASAVTDLKNSIASRDLSFDRDAKATNSAGKLIQANYVVNRSELGKAVSASIALRHEP